jgi:chemotaxis methyl-accepting protein methylase
MIGHDEPGFAALTRAISRGAGLALDAYKDKCLRRRIAVRMRAVGAHTYGEYQAVLERTPAELERLKDALTINVTRFYRNRETWDLLRSRLIPALVQERQGKVRIWSAGCASGEEPYTLAMLFADACDALGHAHWLERVEIDATDIDRTSMERATAGWYPSAALSEIPPDLVARHFEARGDGWQIAGRLGRRVQVRPLDLTRERPLRSDYDLILCRNVVIYFDKPMQERLFATFAGALVPGGHLVLGKVETLLGPARDRLVLVDPRERLYRRPA